MPKAQSRAFVWHASVSRFSAKFAGHAKCFTVLMGGEKQKKAKKHIGKYEKFRKFEKHTKHQNKQKRKNIQKGVP